MQKPFDLLREFRFATDMAPVLDQYLKSVMETSDDKVWATLFVDPQDANVTHLNLMAQKPAWMYLEDLAGDIERKLHELQPENKRRADGICEGTGKELKPQHMYHRLRHRPAVNEIYYEERLQSAVKLYHRLDAVSEKEFGRMETPLKQAVERLNSRGGQEVAAVVMEKDLRPAAERKEYEIRIVGLPPVPLRGEFREGDEKGERQMQFLKKDHGMELEFRKIKSALGGLRERHDAQGI